MKKRTVPSSSPSPWTETPPPRLALLLDMTPEPMSARALLSLLAKNPLYPFKVIGLIHYQAVKLFLKGIRHFHKPAPPGTSVSHG